MKLFFGEKAQDNIVVDIWLIYVIKTLVLPVSSLLILSFYGCFYVLKNKGSGGVLLVVPLLCLFLLTLPVVAVFLGQLQQKYPVLNYSVLKDIKPQVIVVLAGGVISFAPEYEANMTVNTRTLVRARYTAYLAKKTKLPVLTSGGSVFGNSDKSEASILASVLRDEFNAPVTWMETHSRNTAENALYSQKILAKEHIQRIVLVTHAIHMSRAVEQFKRVGMTVIPAPTSLFPNSKLDIFSFLPSASALEMSSMVIHEWLGGIWYGLKYNDL